MDELYTKLANLAARYGAQRLVLYGSRARGDFHERSDIDLAVYGMPENQRGGFSMETEDLPTLLKLDIVHVSQGMDPAFLKNIEKDGVTLYAAKD
jgi:predicted nucleotidyltransferase